MDWISVELVRSNIVTVRDDWLLVVRWLVGWVAKIKGLVVCGDFNH